MPVYEYTCDQCNARFSKLQPMSAPRDGNECPHCGARTTRRVMSAFSSTASGGASASGCGPGGGRFT